MRKNALRDRCIKLCGVGVIPWATECGRSVPAERFARQGTGTRHFLSGCVATPPEPIQNPAANFRACSGVSPSEAEADGTTALIPRR